MRIIRWIGMAKMEPKLIIFDADGTLRRCTIFGQPCPNNSEEWELMPNVKETLIEFSDIHFGIASNQAGVAYGYLDDDTAAQLLYDLEFELFGNTAFVIFCPHAVESKCKCRKPETDMLDRIMDWFTCLPSETLYVGDMESDEQAAINVGCSFMWAKDFFSWEE